MMDLYLIFQFVKGRFHGNQILCRSGLVHSEPKYLMIRWTDFHKIGLVDSAENILIEIASLHRGSAYFFEYLWMYLTNFLNLFTI